jgi:hypothetical protein
MSASLVTLQTARSLDREIALIGRVCSGETQLFYELISPYERRSLDPSLGNHLPLGANRQYVPSMRNTNPRGSPYQLPLVGIPMV